MSIFNKNKLKIFWSFSQSGNIWRFIFGGDKYIIGETRDTVDKKLYLFTLDYTTGKIYLKDFTFENENFWVAIEGANEKYFFLGRFENPQLPFQKNIIALDIESGEKKWENEIYSYLLNTRDRIFGIKRKFESSEISEINIDKGNNLRVLNESEHLEIFNLKNQNEDYINENSNYPIVFDKEYTSQKTIDTIENFCKGRKDIENIEYIEKDTLLIFNYYVNLKPGAEEGNSRELENRFAIIDLEKQEILFEDILNKNTCYCVPDNFFIRNNYIFYLKEKNFLNCIKF